MNERVFELANESGFDVDKTGTFGNHSEIHRLKKFAELIVRECTDILFNESERLYGYSTECDNMRESEEAELVAEKCVDLITMIEEHLGVK
jgi:hypothetical protein